MDENQKNWELLANAIIVQASKDYQRLLCGDLLEGGRDTLQGIRNFFNSGYFKGLTKVDGPSLMHRLEREVLEYHRDYRAIKKAHGKMYDDYAYCV